MNTQPSSHSHTSSPITSARRTSKFRFKSTHSRSTSTLYSYSHPYDSSHRHHRHHHRDHSHYSRRQRSSPIPPPLSPNAAFRESLFDALADDEGAAFWEGVYGQPIHTYSPYVSRSSSDGGELERMDDEEYVAYVRAKMWEKSHGFVIEERMRREEQRKKDRKKEEERKAWDKKLEEVLRRGEDRRRRSRWKQCWKAYLDGWENLKELSKKEKIKDQILWPVLSGKREDFSRREVERFFKNAPQPNMGESEANIGHILKAERVRWHPDKIQQRFGSQGIDEETMKMVTAVFQVIDSMWSDA